VIAAFLAILSIPVAIAIAILKHRLYDIDLIINRTLVYGALTVLLALVYVAGVLGIGGVARALTASGSNSVAVAASTLIVAAVFRPARARIQGFIDRRFYRRKYDASKTLETFSTKLRDEVDLDALTAELVAVTSDVMRPRHVSLWLRQG
jgi:small-conductance mechanosensitive channel